VLAFCFFEINLFPSIAVRIETDTPKNNKSALIVITSDFQRAFFVLPFEIEQLLLFFKRGYFFGNISYPHLAPNDGMLWIPALPYFKT
jgi:hypothetical protein